MSGAHLLLVAAPLRLTLWVLAIAGTVIVAVIATMFARHYEWVRLARRRERVRAELEPVFSSFFATEDSARLADELRPAFLQMDAAHRPVAAVLISDFMRDAPDSHKEKLRNALEQSGIVELGERGTRRLSPWRRALACEMLGKIGSRHAVPALVERLEDRRPEVRIAAVRALGDIGSIEALPALTEAFLGRTAVPTNVANQSLRLIGPDAATSFKLGILSPDPTVRVSSCFGLAAVADDYGSAALRLASILGTERESQVRTAAAAALGIVGGDEAPASLVAATADPDQAVRRSAVKALGSFDDPNTGEVLLERTEDEDRETALRAAEALVKLAGRPRAAAQTRARLESSSSWAIEYAQTVAEVSA